MTNANGTWNLVIESPIGRQEFTLDLTSDDSTVTGTATTRAETVTVKDGHFDSGSLTFSMDLKKPFPMTVVHHLTLDGDKITGTAQAGAFPASEVTGERA